MWNDWREILSDFLGALALFGILFMLLWAGEILRPQEAPCAVEVCGP